MKINYNVPMKDLERVTPRDIANNVKWDDVKKSLRYYYPDFTWNSYSKVFKLIKNYKKSNGFIGGKIEISVCGFIRFGDDSVYGDMRSYGIHIKLDKPEAPDKYGFSNKTYSMSFQPWAKMANTSVDTETLRRYTFEEVLAHFIYEITWYGPEKKMNKIGKEILNRAKDVIKKNK